MGKKKFFSAKQITGLAVLLALVIVLQLIGGYLKVGATSFNFTLVPVVLGGILYGAWAGAFLGFACGFITLMYGITGADSFTHVLFQAQPVVTILLCLLKVTAAGIVSGLLYKAIAKKNEYLAVLVAAAVAPIVNTGLFIAGSLCFLQGTLQTNLVNFGADGQTVLYFVFIGCAGINFLVELAINLIAAPSIYRVIGLVQGKKGGKTKI